MFPRPFARRDDARIRVKELGACEWKPRQAAGYTSPDIGDERPNGGSAKAVRPGNGRLVDAAHSDTSRSQSYTSKSTRTVSLASTVSTG